VTSKLAREIAGVTEDDWFVLGPSLAVPSYDHFINMEEIQHQFHDRPLEELQQQASDLIDELRTTAEVPTSVDKLQYNAEYAVDQRGNEADTQLLLTGSRTGTRRSCLRRMARMRTIWSFTPRRSPRTAGTVTPS